MRGIAVLDAGGQYCHLLARRVRQTHVLSHVLPVDVAAAALKDVSGIIISGGPRSVSEPNAPRIDPSILELGIPILGICYGHQLLASMLPGGLVKRSHASEYGVASLRLASSSASSILSNVETPSLVWMSHGDSVESVPDGFETLASTDECSVAAMANPKRRIFGVQFHPEVSHTEHGQQILENFVRRVCGVEDSWRPDSLATIQGLKSEIAAAVGPARKVLFFVSGGVDSSVAYKLCADAVGEDRLRGIYINTGFMRKNESAEV
ncbi:MAG TPA: glutamine-hydrolyzing GMP synthase, partial [Vicinamibacterales bacterium]|nr:glutamine-hydrolyzing GMP synthase [Vicinamibacterales bacterium]